MTHKLAILGMGKMGNAIDGLAASHGFEVVARVHRAEAAFGINMQTLNGADVAIDVTTPDAAPGNIRAVVNAGCPIVVGTTGWYDQFDAIRDDVLSRGGALLTATNFSVGVNIFEQVVELAARLLGRVPSFAAHLTETHHSAKVDAPSGTARTLNTTASAAWGRGSDIPITSIRTGSVPGTHEFVFDAPFEQIHLEHIARDRRVFAEGALVAAAWLIGKRGTFTMRDVLTDSLNESNQ